MHPKSPYNHRQIRTFIAARIKWVRDPYLDKAVSKEKNLKQAISLKNQITSSPLNFLPLSSLSLLKSQFDLPNTSQSFLQKYPSFFTLFQPSPSLPLHVKLTHHAFNTHKEELAIYNSHKNDIALRLAKLLMLTKVNKLPLHVIDMFKFDLGLPYNYIQVLLCDFPDYFTASLGKDCVFDDKETLFLELITWKDELCVSEMKKRVSSKFDLSYPNGFDLKKNVQDWMFEWQNLPYISPYENAFHLNWNSGHFEKWVVAVLHELLWLLVSKKTDKENVLVLGKYLGFDDRFEKALKHYPGVFYVSNKIRTQTVVLREAYRKDMLMVKHPLMGMRFRYIHLMIQDSKKCRRSDVGALGSRSKRHSATTIDKRRKKDVVIDRSWIKDEI